MARNSPLTELAPRFSSEGAKPTSWAEAIAMLNTADIYWLSTVRPDGRPHVTPLFAGWLDDALYFCTGADERKAKNLAANPHCVMTTGCNVISDSLDIVIEGDAVRVIDESTLQRVAELYATKYDWQLTFRDGALIGEGGNVADVYKISPTTAFGFRKGESFCQTRWRFQ